MVCVESKNILLREFEISFLPILHTWRNEEVFLKNCTMRKEEISFEEFCEEISADFRNDRHTQFVAFRKSDSVPVGTIWSYAYSKRDGYCFVTTYIHPLYKRKGYGAEMFVRFLEYLIDTYSLFKVYTDVYSSNADSLTILLKAGFQIEGRFKGHRCFGGERRDLIRLAFFGEQKHKISEFLQRFEKVPKGGEKNGSSI
jgi:RimJ/RimL family protein N-acetyltransferase